MSGPDPRHDQMFPTLDAAQVALARRFAGGEARRFPPGAPLFEMGSREVAAWLVLEGRIDVLGQDSAGREAFIVGYGPGQISGEVGLIGGRATLARGRAGEAGCLALPYDAAHLRALLIGSAELGELLMRAFILRRMRLIEAAASGSVLVGRAGSAALTRLDGFLTRNGQPHALLDVATPDGEAMVRQLGLRAEDLPVMLCPRGVVLRRPTEAEVGRCLGLLPEFDPSRLYDVAVVGAGPAGLATAVYAASEGLSVIVLDQRAFGGQAGASARIENYLGFPTGISGQALAGRAFNQALKFGAEVAIPTEVLRLDCPEPAEPAGAPLRLQLAGDAEVRARTVVIASGVAYRRPPVPTLAEFEGAGISYWASPVEAKLCEGEEVMLVGGGNSAGQAVVYLAPRVRRLHLVVRGPGLEATMSRYLIERIAALPNVVLRTGTEVVRLDGDRATGLAGMALRRRADGAEEALALRHLFLFIGADPHTAWLEGCVALDDKGFVLTGAAGAAAGADSRLPLETSRPGVFAIGDVRAGSTKRVAAAVGEGAAVVAQIHAMLARRRA
ncbi:FAD-dependent oxidoreductase [Roseomonas sp. NAR14]|uniref:Thioredoxin reductase n=1 Tax=Roseomonas acroporae TaxID=2937791 RepID=A0A9X1YDE2_9PROT|nr:FAD-dependent oxidoreductase [Roseomonas acroporae]MCK8787720.1 FAD-dependent oxidoreductase [Roseomonas acroporae]